MAAALTPFGWKCGGLSGTAKRHSPRLTLVIFTENDKSIRMP
jgi:hypothetical protein